MNHLAYYAGCSLHSSAREYHDSLVETFKILDISLDEIREWTCCGTSPRISISNTLSLSLSAVNLLEVKSEGYRDVVVPCAACFSRFKTAQHEIGKNLEVKQKVEKVLGREYDNGVRVIHPLELLNAPPMLDAIRRKAVVDMKGLKVVCYYGCLLTRPPKIVSFDNYENPVSMDKSLSRAGFTVVDWSYKTECCGASLVMTRKEIALKLCRDILTDAAALGADCIATACPMCQGNLDTRQEEIDWQGRKGVRIPVLYFSQLLGLAFGVSREKLGLQQLIVSPSPLLERLDNSADTTTTSRQG